MGPKERRWLHSRSRRKALAALAGLAAGSPLIRSGAAAQLDPRPLKDHRRLPGLDEMATAFDFEPVMFANIPLSVYDYTAHGDGSEFTLRRNRQAFAWVDLVPGTPVDPAQVDLSCELFGMKMTRLGVLALNVTHDNEHYGNFITYLRIKGLVPPSSQGPGM